MKKKSKADSFLLQARDDGGLVPLHNACSFGHLDVVTLLIKSGACVNVKVCIFSSTNKKKKRKKKEKKKKEGRKKKGRKKKKLAEIEPRIMIVKF